MAVVYELEHVTAFTYKKPVTFAQHRALFVPRVGHGGRLYNYSIETNVRSDIRWIGDPLANNVALIDILEPTSKLVITFKFRGAHFGARGIAESALEPRGQSFPVQYTPDEWTDLAAFMRPHANDPDGSVAAWGRSFLSSAGNDTSKVLTQMMDEIRDTFK